MIRPDFLTEGNTVGIVSPSGPIKKDSLDFAIETLHAWGLRVSIGKNAYKRHGVFAGTDTQRCEDMQKMLDDKRIKTIICARGGYGAIRIAEMLDYKKFLKNPKWLVGFSDITVFHAICSHFDIESIHGVMAKGFASVSADSLQSLHDALFGKPQSVSYPSAVQNRHGACQGELVGGNLSMLYSMRGVDFEYDYKGKILFIEDLNEYLYHIDRMIQNLKHSGILANISGLIVGTMSGMRNGIDEYSGSVESIIRDAVAEYSYPVCFNFPSGHEEQNQALFIGREYKLSVDRDFVSLSDNCLV